MLVHGSRRAGARAGAPVRPRVDVRRARRVGRRTGVVLLGTHRPRPRRCRTGPDGTLRGLVNVCRHRGHLVVEGTGCRETLQCPYHAWTYELDGTLRKAPRAEREPGFDPAGLSLAPVSVGTWGPFVFVNPDAHAAPLEAALGRLPEIVAESGLDLAAIRFHSHHEWPIEANWKVVMENFLECYHCPTAHPGFSKVIDVSPDAYCPPGRTRPSRARSARPASALAGNGNAAYTPRGDVVQAQYHFLFPSTTLNIAPGHPEHLDGALQPGRPPADDRGHRLLLRRRTPPQRRSRSSMAWDNQVAEEDVSLVQSVQRGLESGAVPQGR